MLQGVQFLQSLLPCISVDDMRANTEYSGYSPASPVIQWFWEVAQGFSKEDKARLLQFVTGTSKVLVCILFLCFLYNWDTIRDMLITASFGFFFSVYSSSWLLIVKWNILSLLWFSIMKMSANLRIVLEIGIGIKRSGCVIGASPFRTYGKDSIYMGLFSMY